MNDHSKLPQSWAGSAIAWLLTIITWCVSHIGILAGILAVLASAFSIWASLETVKLRRKQQSALTRGQKQEPETET